MQSLLSGGCLYNCRAVPRAAAMNEESEDEEMVGEGDFRGVFIKDKDSKLRKMINRIKTRTVSDPVMNGKIINASGGRLVRFCADTG